MSLTANIEEANETINEVKGNFIKNVLMYDGHHPK